MNETEARIFRLYAIIAVLVVLLAGQLLMFKMSERRLLRFKQEAIQRGYARTTAAGNGNWKLAKPLMSNHNNLEQVVAELWQTVAGDPVDEELVVEMTRHGMTPETLEQSLKDTMALGYSLPVCRELFLTTWIGLKSRSHERRKNS